MDRFNTAPSEHRKIDFEIHGVVRVRLIDPWPSDLVAASKRLGSPSKLPRTDPDITVRFVEDLPVCGIRFLGTDKGFTDDGFFLLREGAGQVKARIPFDRIGGPCEIVCRSRIGSVPLLMQIVGLTALQRECVPIHASAVVHNGVGLLMPGWAHCGKTTALLGFASKGADYVGEDLVFLSGTRQTMHGLVRPMELSHWHVSSLPHVRSAVSLLNRCAFHGIGALEGLQRTISGERTQSSLVFRSLQRASAAIEHRLRPAIAPSVIFRDRIRSAGVEADKIFLFVSQEDQRIDVEPVTPFEMARRLTLLAQHELTPLLGHYAAYRFAFPTRRNEFIESAAQHSLAILDRALRGKETYIVRLPYPHVFPDLFKAIQPYCKPTSAPAAESIRALV